MKSDKAGSSIQNCKWSYRRSVWPGNVDTATTPKIADM
jgi:hypothetical protein